MFEIIVPIAIIIVLAIIPTVLVYLTFRGNAYWSGYRDGNKRLSYMNTAKTEWEAKLYDKGYNEGYKAETEYTPGEVFTRSHNNHRD